MLKRLKKIFISVFDDTDLIVVPSASVPQNNDDFDKSTSSNTFLPRLQLMTSNSKLCKSGEFPINHFAVVRDQNHQDIGTTVDCLVMAWRPKAIDMEDEVIVVYDINNPEFERIQNAASIKDSECMFGPEFLLYLPESQTYTTFFMGTITSRREAPNVKARMHKAATFKAGKIETKKYTYFSPVITPCSTPFDVPAQDEFLPIIEEFHNPKDSEVEKAAEPDTGRER